MHEYNHSMTEPQVNALPATPEAITAGWLARVLDVPVESVEVLERHSGTTGRALLRVVWGGGVQRPGRLFAKLPPPDAVQARMVSSTDMGRREARFYAGLAPGAPVRVPRAYWSGWGTEPSGYLILLEDLAGSGCDFPRGSDPAILDYVRMLMDELARLHAHFHDWPLRFAARSPWVGPSMRNDWGRRLVQVGLETFRDEASREFAQLGELYVAHMEVCNELMDRGPHTLIHGDCHLGNLFRDRCNGDRPGFLDWACVAHGPGLRDVAYFLCNSIAPELRRREERALLERYRAGLAAGGVAVPPFEETWRDYRLLALASWVSATATAAVGGRMQPLRIGLRAIERTTAAAQDLGTLSLLRAELGNPAV